MSSPSKSNLYHLGFATPDDQGSQGADVTSPSSLVHKIRLSPHGSKSVWLGLLRSPDNDEPSVPTTEKIDRAGLGYHIFITSRLVPVSTSNVKAVEQLGTKLKATGIKFDAAGFYITFEETRQGVRMMAEAQSELHDSSAHHLLFAGCHNDRVVDIYPDRTEAAVQSALDREAVMLRERMTSKPPDVKPLSIPHDQQQVTHERSSTHQELTNQGSDSAHPEPLQRRPSFAPSEQSYATDSTSVRKSLPTHSSRSSPSSSTKNVCSICKQPARYSKLLRCTACGRFKHKRCDSSTNTEDTGTEWHCQQCKGREGHRSSRANTHTSPPRLLTPSRTGMVEAQIPPITTGASVQAGSNAVAAGVVPPSYRAEVNPVCRPQNQPPAAKPVDFAEMSEHHDQLPVSILPTADTAAQPGSDDISPDTTKTTCSPQRIKPPNLSYSELGLMALLQSPQRRLPVKSIIAWIVDNVKGYEKRDTKLQGGISNWLSIWSKKKDPVIEKISEGSQGGASIWAVVAGKERSFPVWDPVRWGKDSVELPPTPLKGINPRKRAHVGTVTNGDGIKESPISSHPPVSPTLAERPHKYPRFNRRAGDGDPSAHVPSSPQTGELNQPGSVEPVTLEATDSSPIVPQKRSIFSRLGEALEERMAQGSADSGTQPLSNGLFGGLASSTGTHETRSPPVRHQKLPGQAARGNAGGNTQAAEAASLEPARLTLTARVTARTSTNDHVREDQAQRTQRSGEDGRVVRWTTARSSSFTGPLFAVPLETIRARPTRKQMLRMRNRHISRLGHNTAVERASTWPELLTRSFRNDPNNSMASTTNNDTEYGAAEIDFENSLPKQYNSIEEVLEMPPKIKPIIHNGDLAFTDDVEKITGRPTRTRHIYRVGAVAMNRGKR